MSRDAAVFLLQRVLEKKASIVCQGIESRRNSVLHVAVESPDWTVVEEQQFSMVRLLIERFSSEPEIKEAINMANANGDTTLHFAALSGDFKAAQILLQNGANPNAVNSAGWTPYMNARLSWYFILQIAQMNPGTLSRYLSTLDDQSLVVQRLRNACGKISDLLLAHNCTVPDIEPITGEYRYLLQSALEWFAAGKLAFGECFYRFNFPNLRSLERNPAVTFGTVETTGAKYVIIFNPGISGRSLALRVPGESISLTCCAIRCQYLAH